jgi:hypothetical protein
MANLNSTEPVVGCGYLAMGSPGAEMIMVRHEYLKVDTAVKAGQNMVVGQSHDFLYPIESHRIEKGKKPEKAFK